MKKSMIFVLVLFFLAFGLSAQGMYFDIGGGLGLGDSSSDVISIDPEEGESFWGFGIKLGYGPFSSIPLFFAADAIGYTGEIGTYAMIGASAVYYPIRLVQLSAGAGYSLMVEPVVPQFGYNLKSSGFAINTSVALDFGSGKRGLLLALHYTYFSLDITNVLNNNTADLTTHMFGLFIKYASRNKSGR